MISFLLGLSIATLVYWPELFPRCCLCRKVKPRFSFPLHKDISFSLSRKGNRSVCKRCCSQANITSFSELDLYEELKKRTRYQTKANFEETPPHW